MAEINLALGCLAILLSLAATFISADACRMARRANKILDRIDKEG